MPIWEYGPERAVYRIFHCGGQGLCMEPLSGGTLVCTELVSAGEGYVELKPQLGKDFWKK